MCPAACPEAAMTFHCCCGATLQATARTIVCPECGETVEVVRCAAVHGGQKYKLRISRHHPRPASQLFLPSAAPEVCYRGSRDNLRLVKLGLFFLLSPILFLLLTSHTPVSQRSEVVDSYPSECGFISNCNCTRVVDSVRNARGAHDRVSWKCVGGNDAKW